MGGKREIIIRTLSAIGQIEIAVKTFWAKLGDNLPHPSIRDMGYVMANIEVIHNKAYERLIDVLGLEHVFEENLKFIIGITITNIIIMELFVSAKPIIPIFKSPTFSCLFFSLTKVTPPSPRPSTYC